ncbi:hypothetical protein GCM10009087_03640 [Sphingomonas oligophenolica]|uniref:Caspase family protein n=1 Tax=Sphingomonas oligophenolica TaxID=301154 RepID=A0ABU9Y652_9SPHN
MASTAILVGNATYSRQDSLPCCIEDVAAMKALVEATGRYSAIHALTDLDADGMREAVRTAISADDTHDEVFFYFSGHGTQIGTEFYYCGTQFDDARPNETGVSNAELHNLLRAVNPDLLVKVVDACFSGTLLVKGNLPQLAIPKDGFRHVLQFSSSLDSQTSLAGEPLSVFTRAFCDASVRKTSGPIYFTDIFNTLRDDYLGNDEQTPFFVSQSTGRELLVDDATKLAEFRELLTTRWSGFDQGEHGAESALAVTEPLSAKKLLLAAEGRLGNPERVKLLIDELFDGVLARFNNGEFGEFFEVDKVEHATYQEVTARDLIIRVLARETRPDRLVTAEIPKAKTKSDAFGLIAHSMVALSPEWMGTEHYSLELNCTLTRAQLRLNLTPRFRTLQRLVLVLSCAPSLDQCYIFEILTQHLRTDWDRFAQDGSELVRRWYKLGWDEEPDGIIEKVCVALENAARKHIEETAARLAKE